MATSDIEICNRALLAVGGSLISSFSESTQEAAIMNVLYESTFKEVAITHPWSTLVKRASLNLTNNSPEFEYSYEFQLPTSPLCLRVLNIQDNDTGLDDFRIEGDKLLANVSAISVRYIARLTDPTKYGILFENALVSRLAAASSVALSGDIARQAGLLKIYNEVLMQSITIDSMQGSGEQTYSTTLTEIR